MSNGGRSYQELLFDSTLIIALITSILYLVGYAYYRSFFSELLIPYRSIDLSVAQCITITLDVFTVLIVSCMAYYIVNSSELKNKVERNKYVILLAISLIIVIILSHGWQVIEDIFMLTSRNVSVIVALLFITLICLLSIYIKPQSLPYILALITFVFFQIPSDAIHWAPPGYILFVKGLIAVLLILKTFVHIEPKINETLSAINELSVTDRTFRLILIICLLCCLSALMGVYNAGMTVEGCDHGAIEVNISLKNTNDTLPENKTFILVLLYDGQYYIIEKDENYQATPKLYIIPSDQIIMVIVDNRNEGWVIMIFNNAIDIIDILRNAL